MNRLPAPEVPAWIRSMTRADTERYLIDVGQGQTMAVHECGSGRPVLMVHGNPTWAFLYRKVCMALRREPLRLICPDLIGFGLSSKPDESLHTLENHASWMASLIEQLDLRDAIVVGQDWGGPVGFLGAEAHRDRFAGMVILNTVVSPPRPGFKPTAFHRFARLPVVSDFVFKRLEFPQRALQFAQGDRGTIRGAVTRAYRWPLRHSDERAAPLATARMVPDTQDHPSIAPLARCQAFIESFEGPIRVVWGDNDPILGSVIGWISKLRPDADVVRTQGGHFIQEEEPGLIAEAIRLVSQDASAAA